MVLRSWVVQPESWLADSLDADLELMLMTTKSREGALDLRKRRRDSSHWTSESTWNFMDWMTWQHVTQEEHDDGTAHID